MSYIHHKKLIIVGIIFLMSWLLGTFAIHKFEYGHPIGENYFNAFYFTVITTATIGFGDLVPITPAGKVITMMYAIFYVPLFLYVMTLLFQSRLERLRLADERIEHEVRHVEKDVEIILDEVRHEIPHTQTSPEKTKTHRHLIAKK